MTDNKTIHGTLVCVFDQGVLLTGPAGIGKSQLALDLLDRGHQLIADDLIEMDDSTTPSTGNCPSNNLGYLYITGLGLIEIEKIYGKQSVKPNQTIDIVIKLVDRINPRYNSDSYKSTAITLAMSRNHNMALLVETAVRKHLLILSGQHTKDELLVLS